MPYLFCQQHGHDRDATFAQEQENYRRFGEALLVVKGPLKSASWRCDSCNARLRRGSTAWLVTAFPRSAAAGMDGYDFATERTYFYMERAEVKVYGAEPSGGIPSPATVPAAR